MSDIVAVIPARFASQRFPGKILAAETGKTLIQHVYERVVQATSISRVLIATDDDRIAEAVRAFGGEVMMTRTDHPNGTSRIAEVAETLDSDIIVNVQGDEPELDPALIDHTVKALIDDDHAVVGTLASPFDADEDPADPNIVKVVVGAAGQALYFSRSQIPYPRTPDQAPSLKHVGLYVYRRPFLATYITLPETPLESTERLEQLRVLEHGYRIAVAVRKAAHSGIDTPEEYAAFVARCRAASGSVS